MNAASSAPAPAPPTATAPRVTIRDLIALTKPRVSALVLSTCLGGLYLAPARPSLRTALLALAGTLLIVGGANALNMYIERDSDGKMRRTRDRPLPAGRLAPGVALAVGIALFVASVPVLALGVNPLTAAVGAFAFASYVLVYTPMKRRSSLAIWVGAVPGAAPPVMGYAAATGRIDAAAMALFALLFLWQVPHFLAIAIFRAEDYGKAGLKVEPLVRGVLATKIEALAGLLALVPASVSLVPLGVAGTAYLGVAIAAGAVFLGWGLYGFRAPAAEAWAKRLFLISLVYLPVVFVALALDATRG